MNAYAIPARLNLILSAATLSILLTILFLSSKARTAAELIVLAVLFGIFMNTGYALIHEAEHGILHPNRKLNDLCGVVLALLFPAPFHLIRQGHIGHHMRNRSDDEAFDFYFERESRLWRYMQLYGTLTGFFWATIALSNFISAVGPRLLRKPITPFDRSTLALQDSLNPKYELWIQLEAIGVFVLHAALIVAWSAPVVNYLFVLFGFGFAWSAMQYAHHFGTERDVLRGARNLRTFRLLDRIWLNHNWHLNHHLRPTIPWIHLPKLFSGIEYEKRGSLLAAYFRMWRGPRFSADRVQNRFAGRIIQ